MVAALLADHFNPNLLWLLLAPLPLMVLLVIIAMNEKRHSPPYVEIPQDRLGQLSRYVRRMSDDALASGLVFGAYIGHFKPSIKIIGTVWYSPDKRILVMTNSGTVSGIPAKMTMIFSPVSDGTYLCTTDNIGESDPAGMIKFKRRWNGLLPDLLRIHQRRMEHVTGTVRSFPQATAFEAVNEFYRLWAQNLVNKGLARFRDADQQWWSYNFTGGLQICRCFCVQLGQTAVQFWRQFARGAGSAV
jgi:hypothetical protein